MKVIYEGGGGETPEPPGLVVGSGNYALVTDASTLEAGDKILIAYINEKEKVKLVLGTEQKTNNRAATDDVTLNSDGTLTPGDEAQIITLEESDGYYLFNVGNGYLYAASSNANQLKTEPKADDNAKAAISISKGSATITFQGTNTRNTMRYNPNASNNAPLFSCYVSTSTTGSLPQIYRKMPIKGDVNGDDKVDIVDVTMTISHLLSQNPAGFIKSAADMDGDGDVDFTDVTAIIDMVLKVE